MGMSKELEEKGLVTRPKQLVPARKDPNFVPPGTPTIIKGVPVYPAFGASA